MHLPYRFGRYILTEKIAQGGMAEIFKAKYVGESGFSKEVAIKRLLSVWTENPSFVTMLVDEAKALVHLSHPNIVQVFELGRDGKHFYISMEWVAGIDLRSLFLKVTQDGKPLPLPFILFLISEILKALDYAHNKKDDEGNPLHLVHRDVSPQNVLISFEGQVKLADFGIAKGSHRSLETTHTEVKGKYGYMSPEQARGEMVDPRTDLYAVGVILYELLERKRLFEGANDLAVLHQVREGCLPREALQSWSGPLRAVVLKALQKDPRHRYQQASQFLLEVQRLVQQDGEGIDAPLLGDFLRGLFPKKPERRKGNGAFSEETASKPGGKKKWGLAGGAVFVLILAGAAFFWRGVSPPAAAPNSPQPPLNIRGGDSPHPPLSIRGGQGELPPLPPLRGSVTVDAKPKALKGIVRLDGEEKNFVTPFHWGNLELVSAKKGIVKLEPEGGKEIAEEFVLSPDHPHWVKTFEVLPPEPGVLRVQARPWGEVTIPGVIQGRETPVNGLRLREGEYRVRVFFPPKGRWAEGSVSLRSGAQKICQASFIADPVLTCR